jgi:hypothetical protein
MTPTWVDTDAHDVLIETVPGPPESPQRRARPTGGPRRGRPRRPEPLLRSAGPRTEVTEDGAREHIDELSERYIGAPYPWFGGRDQVRLLVRIPPHKVTLPRG